MGLDNRLNRRIRIISFGEQMSTILQYLDSELIFNAEQGNAQPRYTKEGFISAANIFLDVITDKAYDLAAKENMSDDDLDKFITKCEDDLLGFIKTYTGVDLKEQNISLDNEL
jgi:hypothetical protein